MYKYTFVDRNGFIAEQTAETLSEALEKQEKFSGVKHKVVYEFLHMAVIQCISKNEYCLGITWKPV